MRSLPLVKELFGKWQQCNLCQSINKAYLKHRKGEYHSSDVVTTCGKYSKQKVPIDNKIFLAILVVGNHWHLLSRGMMRSDFHFVQITLAAVWRIYWRGERFEVWNRIRKLLQYSWQEAMMDWTMMVAIWMATETTRWSNWLDKWREWEWGVNDMEVVNLGD